MPRLIAAVICLIIACAASFGALHKPRNPYTQYMDTTSERLYEIAARSFEEQKMDSAAMFLTMLVNRDTTNIGKETRLLMTRARNMLGVINFIHANYPGAYLQFQKAIELYDVPNAAGYLNLSSIYLYYGDKVRAFRLIKPYFEAVAKIGDFDQASIALENVLTLDFTKAGIPAETIRGMVEQFKNFPKEAANCKNHPMTSLMAEAWLLGDGGKHLEATAKLKKALGNTDSLLLPPRNRHSLCMMISREYAKAGMTDSVRAYLDRAAAIARDNDYKELLAETYSDAAEYYTGIGDLARGKDFRFRMLEINDSLFNPRELGKIHDLEMMKEVNDYERKMEVMAIREKTRNSIIIVVVSALCAVFVMMFALYRQYRSLRKKTESLFEHNIEELRQPESPIFPDDHTNAGKDIDDVLETPRSNEGQSPLDPEGTDNDSEQTRSGGLAISAETRLKIRNTINEVFADESVFCKEGFSLNELTQICGSNPRYISQVINEDLSMSFTQLLNEKRVKVAKRHLADFENYGHMTIESIISELGIKSRSTFSKTFKRLTGLSPSEFQRLAREHKQPV